MNTHPLTFAFNKEISPDAISTFLRPGLESTEHIVIEKMPTLDGGTLAITYVFNGQSSESAFAYYYASDKLPEALNSKPLAEMDPQLVKNARQRLLQLGGNPF